MSKRNDDNRVISRIGARELTEKEITEVTGAIFRPRCTLDPSTCTMDGICSPPPAC